MIKVKTKGNFSKTFSYLKKKEHINLIKILNVYGKKGVEALSSATPKKTGLTANSWRYEIEQKKGVATISFHNSNIQNGVPIALVLEYGHATNNGGWVQGYNYINPSIQPIFDELTKSAWKEVSKI